MRLAVSSSNVPVLAKDPDFLEGWDRLVERTAALRKRVAAKGSLGDAREDARNALDLSSDEEFSGLVSASATVRRAVLMLWAEDRALAEKTLTPTRFNVVAGPSVQLSTMGISALLILYLTHFSSMNRWHRGVRAEVEKALHHHRKWMGRSRLLSDALRTLRDEDSQLLSAEGPDLIARRAMRERTPLDTIITELGLAAYRSSEFGAATAMHYFLQRIDSADPQKHHSFLDELRQSESLRTRMPQDGRLLGHHAVEALAERGNDLGASDHWMDTILAIAGDPRLRHSEAWTTWWGSISDSARDATIRWLGRRDLQLFLDAYQRFLDSSSLEDARRMFEDRKVFLEGLLGLDLVKETRLFAGDIARQDIRALAGADVLKTITPLAGSRMEAGATAVIAIDCGHFQLVEGSHNFQLWVYYGARIETLFDRSQAAVPLTFFRKTVPEQGATTTTRGSGTDHQSFRHRGSTWQVNALEFLHRRGVSLPVHALMSQSSFEEYVRLHGTPVELL